jgi:hypothetical protein
VWLLTGCNAPHDNPLDPKSSHYIAPTPQLSGHVYSRHISSHYLDDIFSVNTDLSGLDATSMDSAWVAYDTTRAKSMELSESGIWVTSFDRSTFQDPELTTIIGRPFHFWVLAANGIRYEIAPAYVWRIIDAVPVINSPVNFASTDSLPVLAWQPFPTLRKFHFLASVLQRIFVFDSSGTDSTGVDSTLWTSSQLPVDARSVQVTSSLDSGNYFWTLTVEDDYGNTSRSKEGEFLVNRVGGSSK